jgi:DnaJ-class molecular chaperone
MGRTYYEVLEISPNATLDDIKRAYRVMARRFHPDSGSAESSEEKFQEVQEAYNTLTNVDRKNIYDQVQEVNQNTSTARSDSSKLFREDFHGSGGVGLNGKISNTIKREEAGDSLWSKVTKSFFTKPEDTNTHTKKSEDKSTSASFGRDESDERVFQFTVDALESIIGASRELALKNADGTPRLIKVRIPAGSADGSTLRIKLGNGESVRIKIFISDHRNVLREGNNITLRVPITLGEALNGTQTEIPGIHGPLKFVLTPNWDVAKRIRYKQQGLGDGDERGDFYIEAYIVLPQEITQDARRAAMSIEQCYVKNPRSILASNLFTKQNE